MRLRSGTPWGPTATNLVSYFKKIANQTPGEEKHGVQDVIL